MHVRIASWNVDSRPSGSLDPKRELLEGLAPDLALLQELRRPVYRSFLPHAQVHQRLYGRARPFAWGVLSTDLDMPPAPDRRMGCAVLGGRHTALLDARQVDDTFFPGDDGLRRRLGNRTVVAHVALADGSPLVVACLRWPRAANPEAEGERVAFEAGVASWLAGVSGTLVCALDVAASSSPGADPLPVPADLRVLEAPLGLPGGLPPPGRRRNVVLASRTLEVAEVARLDREAAAAGSDHPVVVVDLATGAGPPP